MSDRTPERGPDRSLSMSIRYRTLDYANAEEVRRYLTLFYAIPRELDEYHVERSTEFIDRSVAVAQQKENPTNTFAGIALDQSEIVGLHILRRFEEGESVGVHIAGLWVAEAHRGAGVARNLKQRGETWARSIGANFIDTNVLLKNSRMLEINARAGFEARRTNLRKRLLPAVRAVIFDLDDTLTDRRLTIAAYAREFVRAFRERLADDDPVSLANELTAADRDGYNPDRAKDIAERRIWSTAVEPSEIAAHWSRHFPAFTVARDHCKETLLALRAAGLLLAVVTNGWTESQHRKLHTLGIQSLLEAVIVSEAFGAKKPDPRIFQAAFDSLGLAAEDCAFVGDNPEKDVRGAAAIGLHAIWLAASLPWPPALPPPKYLIDNLNELLPLLGLA